MTPKELRRKINNAEGVSIGAGALVWWAAVETESVLFSDASRWLKSLGDEPLMQVYARFILESSEEIKKDFAQEEVDTDCDCGEANCQTCSERMQAEAEWHDEIRRDKL